MSHIPLTRPFVLKPRKLIQLSSTPKESVYENTKDKTNAKIAKSFGCQIGEIDRTQPNPWD